MVPEGCTIINFHPFTNYNLAECNNCALFFFSKGEIFALLSFIDVGVSSVVFEKERGE